MRSKTFGGRSGRTAADTVRVNDAHIRVKPLLSITFKMSIDGENDCAFAISSLWRACICACDQ